MIKDILVQEHAAITFYPRQQMIWFWEGLLLFLSWQSSKLYWLQGVLQVCLRMAVVISWWEVAGESIYWVIYMYAIWSQGPSTLTIQFLLLYHLQERKFATIFPAAFLFNTEYYFSYIHDAFIPHFECLLVLYALFLSFLISSYLPLLQWDYPL